MDDVPAETWISVGGGGNTAVAAAVKGSPEVATGIDKLIRKLKTTLDQDRAVMSARLPVSLGAWGKNVVGAAVRGNDALRAIVGELRADVRARKLEVATDEKTTRAMHSLPDPGRAGLVRRIKDVLGKQVRTQTQYEATVADGIVRSLERLRGGRKNVARFRDREMSEIKDVEARWSERLGDLVEAASSPNDSSNALAGGGESTAPTRSSIPSSLSTLHPPPVDPQIADLGRRIGELSSQIDVLRAERLSLWDDDAHEDTMDLISRARDMDARIGDLARQRMGLADVRRRRVGRSLEKSPLLPDSDVSEIFSMPTRTTNEDAVHRRWRLEDTLGRAVGEMVAEIGDATGRAGRDLERMVVDTYSGQADAAQVTYDALTTALTDDLDLLRGDLPRNTTSFQSAARDAQIELRRGVLKTRENLLKNLEASLGPLV